MIAFVRTLIRLSNLLVARFHVLGSLSTKTGFAPNRTTEAAQEMIVNDGSMTSSPGPIPTAATAACKAAEPLQTAMPCLRPTRLANSSSNLRVKGPSEEIQPESRHSFKYWRSLPFRSGSLTGIGNILIVLFRTEPALL